MSETQAAAEIGRKITIGTITGGPSKWFDTLIANKDKPLQLCAIYGYAAGYKPGATDFGEFIKFQGQFEGVNMMTGEVTRAPQVILPTFLSGSLQAALDMEGAKTVQFAFEIHASYDPAAAQKFIYKIFDRMPAQANDPLDALRGQVQKALGYSGGDETKKLEAPETPAKGGKRK